MRKRVVGSRFKLHNKPVSIEPRQRQLHQKGGSFCKRRKIGKTNRLPRRRRMREISTTDVTSWCEPKLPLRPSHKSHLVGFPVLRIAMPTSQVKVSCAISRPRPPSAPSLCVHYRGHRMPNVFVLQHMMVCLFGLCTLTSWAGLAIASWSPKPSQAFMSSRCRRHGVQLHGPWFENCQQLDLSQ